MLFSIDIVALLQLSSIIFFEHSGLQQGTIRIGQLKQASKLKNYAIEFRTSHFAIKQKILSGSVPKYRRRPRTLKSGRAQPALAMLRRNARLRKEYLYKKATEFLSIRSEYSEFFSNSTAQALEDREATTFDKKRKLQEVPLPSVAFNQVTYTTMVLVL